MPPASMPVLGRDIIIGTEITGVIEVTDLMGLTDTRHVVRCAARTARSRMASANPIAATNLNSGQWEAASMAASLFFQSRFSGAAREVHPTARAASSISWHTSTGFDASEAWLAASVMIFFAPSRPDILF
jgi:hypothetical protein